MDWYLAVATLMNMMRKFLKKKGFTIVELLIATMIVVFVAAGMVVLLGSTAQLSGRRTHHYEALEFALQTVDSLKDYVTADETNARYHINGDDPGAGCGGPGGPPRYALQELFVGGQGHCHPLPAGSMIRSRFGGQRTYTVQDVDLDGDGNPDLKRVVVRMNWTEPR